MSNNVQPPAPINWKRAAFGVFMTVPIIALFYYGLSIDPAKRTDVKSPLPGKPAPAFELARMDNGERVALADNLGSIVVINFWASWCTPCRWEHPELLRLANKYGPRGVRFYGILHQDRKADAEKFLAEVGQFPYPTLLPGTTHAGIEYGIVGVPETFIVDSKGIMAYVKRGPLDPVASPLELDIVLDSLLAAR